MISLATFHTELDHSPSTKLLELAIVVQTHDSNTFVFRGQDNYIFALGNSQERNVGPGVGSFFVRVFRLGLLFAIFLVLGGRGQLPSLLWWALAFTFRCGSCVGGFILRTGIYGLRPHIQALTIGRIVRVEVATSSSNKNV
jgi:hypothetical protein